MIVVSSCLAGIACRFDKTAKPNDEIIALVKSGAALHACPECLAGMKRPSPPSEISGGDGHDVLDGRACVYNNKSENVTASFVEGAHRFLEFVKKHSAECVILKSNSPSCGVSRIYDGSFSGVLKDGCGVTAALLMENGIAVREVE